MAECTGCRGTTNGQSDQYAFHQRGGHDRRRKDEFHGPTPELNSRTVRQWLTIPMGFGPHLAVCGLAWLRGSARHGYFAHTSRICRSRIRGIAGVIGVCGAGFGRLGFPALLLLAPRLQRFLGFRRTQGRPRHCKSPYVPYMFYITHPNNWLRHPLGGAFFVGARLTHLGRYPLEILRKRRCTPCYPHGRPIHTPAQSCSTSFAGGNRCVRVRLGSMVSRPSRK